MENLKAKAFAIRRRVLELVYRAKAGHIGGDFSVCEILVTLYGGVMRVSPALADDKNRDRFILSKGHAAEAYYAVLADRGFFPWGCLDRYCAFGSKYIGHPSNQVRGVEMNTGSLGHGLPVAVGMALAGRMDGAPYRVYVVMGDGELGEGSVWEGAMAAGHYKLGNLTAVVDRNRLQISGGTEEVLAQDPLEARWAAFGWNVLHARGNDTGELLRAFGEAKGIKGRPTVILAKTVKGCGVSFMEGRAEWHHRIPSGEEYRMAMEELTRKEAAANEPHR